MDLSPCRRPGRGRRAFRLGEAGLLGVLCLTALSFAAATMPATVAGAVTGPIDCSTLLIPGTGSYSSTTFQFTEFTTGSATRDNATINGGSDGAVAYAGALSTLYNVTPNFTVASALSPPASQPTVVIGGSESYNLVAANGSVLVGGAASGPITTSQAGATQQQNVGVAGLPFSFSSIEPALGTCSTTYANDTVANGTVTAAGATLKLLGTATSSNVFTVPATELTGITTIELSVPPGSTTLVNVTAAGGKQTLSLTGVTSIEYGCNASFTSGCVVPATEDNSSTTGLERDDTVWNFAPGSFGETSPNPSGLSAIALDSWEGTIVAPDVQLTLNATYSVCGSTFTSTLLGAGNTKYCPFGGTVPLNAQPIPQTPEGLPIALGGLGVLGFTGLVVRRRRATRAARSSLAT